MREIELKFKIMDIDKLLNKLDSLDCKVGELIEQNDTIYVNNLDNVESVEGSVWLRVRKEQDTIELNYKKQSSKKQESKEIELLVDENDKNDYIDELLSVAKDLGLDKQDIINSHYDTMIYELDLKG